MKYICGRSYSKWEDIILPVKQSGLKVAANFSGVKDFYNCCFINELDVIGINYYPSIQQNENEVITQQICNERFYQIINDLEEIKKLYPNKKLVVSEVGCSNNVNGLMVTSSNSNFPTTNTSLVPQKLYTETVFGLLGSKPNLLDGVYWFCFDKGNVRFGFYDNPEAIENVKKYKVGGAI